MGGGEDIVFQMTKKAPYKGLGADFEEKHEPASIHTASARFGWFCW